MVKSAVCIFLTNSLANANPNWFGPWGDWAPCNAECGEGYEIRERECFMKPADCEGQTTERMRCFPALPPCEEQESNQVPVVSNQEPVVSNQEPVVSNQEPVVSNQVPAAENDCGECWEADENGNCVPEAGRVTTICGPDSIKMAIESCVFSGKYNHEDVFVGTEDADSSCKLSFDGSYGWPAYSLKHGLTDCGMSMVHDSENGSIIFQNRMTVPPTSKNGIVTSRQLEWNFQCSYDTSYDITADEISMDATSIASDFAGTGRFNFDMSFYTNANFNEKEEGPHEVGKPVFFLISWTQGIGLGQLEYVPTKCEVVNLANTEEVYPLWDSADELMCDDDTPHQVDFEILFHNSFIFNTTTWKDNFGISYQGFAFDSVTGQIGGQQLQCTVQICDPDDDSSPCKTGCFEVTTTVEPWEMPTTLSTGQTRTQFPCSRCDETWRYGTSCSNSCKLLCPESAHVRENCQPTTT